MNKLELIETLKTEAGLTENEAAVVVHLFFDEMSNALAKDDRRRFGACVRFMSRNTNHTPAGIRKPVNGLRLSRKSFRFLNAEKN